MQPSRPSNYRSIECTTKKSKEVEAKENDTDSFCFLVGHGATLVKFSNAVNAFLKLKDVIHLKCYGRKLVY